MNWPAVIKERRVTDNISTFWDFLPTVADIVGVEVPENIDGLSYLPVLQGEDCKARQHEYIYYEFYEQGGKQSILKDGWKLVKLNMANPEKMVQELYNLNSDPGETNNVINLYPDKAEELNELTTKARTPSIHFRWEQKPKKKK